MEKEKDITKNKAHIVKATVETLNLNISYQKKKQKQRKNTHKKYKRYYDHEDYNLNNDACGKAMKKATIFTMMMKMIMMLVMKRKQIKN